MSKLVHNDALGYYVDITAGVWLSVLQEWLGRTHSGEEVDLIIGIDGKPLIIPKGMALYDGEWVVSTDIVERESIGFSFMTNAEVERCMCNAIINDAGIVQRHPTPNRTELRYFGYIDTNNQPVVLAVRTYRNKRDGNRRICERIAERFDYDIEHNTQYIIDNFGKPANRQEE